MGCCKGNCCAVFTFPSTSEQLRRRWDGYTGVLTEDQTRHKRDDLYIADMLIPLDLVSIAERRAEFDIPGTGRSDLNYYTCHHWDEASKLCKAYSERPEMCADFPYAGTCDYGCDYEAPSHTKVKWAGIRVRQHRPPLMLTA